MQQFLAAVQRLQKRQRVSWVRPRSERTLIFERPDELLRALDHLTRRAREVEVVRAGDSRYVVYVRE